MPNIYVGMHYFKKSNLAKEFYDWLKIIVTNYKTFYKKHLLDKKPDFCSIDVCSAIAIKIMDCENLVTNKSSRYPTFVHMKPKAQNWYKGISNWQDYVGSYLTDDFEFYVGNYKQTGLFHYTEDSFVGNYLEHRMKEIING